MEYGFVEKFFTSMIREINKPTENNPLRLQFWRLNKMQFFRHRMTNYLIKVINKLKKIFNRNSIEVKYS